MVIMQITVQESPTQDFDAAFLSPDEDSVNTNDVVDIIGRISNSNRDQNTSGPPYHNTIDEDSLSSEDVPFS